MNKRDLVGVLVKAAGVLMMGSGLRMLPSAVVMMIFQTLHDGFIVFSLLFPLMTFLPIAVGLHLFFRGSWIADKLTKLDDASQATEG
jgi:hypothetical protein